MSIEEINEKTLMRIKIFSDFCSSDNCKKAFENVYALQPNNNYTIVCDDSYTHAILLNKATPSLRIPKHKVIGLALEPLCFLGLTDTFITYAIKNIGKYCIGINPGLPGPFINHYSFMWHKWKHDRNNIKNMVMSIVVSTKLITPGHRYRHELVRKILDGGLDIHIYGYGAQGFGSDSRIKGNFSSEEPYIGYKYTIAIENTLSTDYISEKYCDPLMNLCIPIYYGASNIEQYFGKQWGYRLTGNIDQDYMLIEQICTDPDKYMIDLTEPYTELNHDGGKAHFSALIDMYKDIQYNESDDKSR